MTEFEKLFNENREFIFKYLLKMTRNVSLAEELTQETFFRAYMNYASLRSKDKTSGWLCQIAKNTYFAWYNQQKKIDSLDNVETITAGESIEDAFIQKELSQKVLLCLHELEEPYKEVLMLSVFGGFSRKDISFIFGKSESWARVTFYRAKQKLLERMRYLNFGTALNEPMGKTLVLYQSNGNMIVLYGCVYTNEKNKTFYYGDCYVFDENGVFIEYIGDVGYLFLDRVESSYFQNSP